MQLSQWMRDDAEDSGPMRIHKWADEVAQLEQRVEAWRDFASVLEFGEQEQVEAARARIMELESAPNDR